MFSIDNDKNIYITLHYITLHYITLHYITLHYITLHYSTCIASATDAGGARADTRRRRRLLAAAEAVDGQDGRPGDEQHRRGSQSGPQSILGRRRRRRDG